MEDVSLLLCPPPKLHKMQWCKTFVTQQLGGNGGGGGIVGNLRDDQFVQLLVEIVLVGVAM